MFMNNRQFAALATVFILLFTSVTAYAERLVPFQGRLTDGANQLIQGVEQVTFAIYDEPTGGTALWTEVHDKVSIIGGQVNVLLGSRTNLDDPDNDPNTTNPVNFTNPRYLGITIGAATNQEMLPRHQLVPSFHARTADHATEADHTLLADRATIATDSEKLGGNLPGYYAVAAGTGDSFTSLTARLDALETFTNAYTVPTGTVMPFAGENLPPGEEVDATGVTGDYYFCEGQLITYQNADGSINTENQALWNVIKFHYGKQDLSGTGGAISFRLPDYRGQFLRGWANGSTNDPDRATRTGFDVDGIAVVGDFVGTNQDHELKSHTHTFPLRSEGGAGGGRTPQYDNLAYAGEFNKISNTGGNETRPINTTVRYIIKR